MLLATVLGSGMAFLDATVVNIALPSAAGLGFVLRLKVFRKKKPVGATTQASAAS